MIVGRLWVVGLVAVVASVCRAAEEEEAVRVYKDVSPVVVALSNVEGSGTGIVIGADGLILTNAHVITSPLPFTATIDVAGPGGATKEVTFKKVDVVGYHPKLDLALVKVDPAEHKVALKAAQVNKAKAAPGQRVYVIGNPAAGKTVLTKSITSGMLSAADRDIPGEPGKYYQVDAAINPGNSGGPLVDKQGRVIGVVTFKFTDAAALGFAIPVHDQDLSPRAFVPLNKRGGDPERSRELWRMADRYGDLGDRAVRREGPDSETAKLFHAYAAICYRMALVHDPGNAVLCENIGTMLRSTDMNAVAIGYLGRAVQLTPWGLAGGGEANANAYRELGLSLAKEKRVPQALAVWLEGLAKYPYADKIWEDLAITYVGQPDKSIEAAEAATLAMTVAQRGGARVNTMRQVVADSRAKAERAGRAAAVDARIARPAIVAKLDKLLAESNAARKAKRVWVTAGFAAVIREVGGPEMPGVDQAIPQQPRERLAELSGGGDDTTAVAGATTPAKPAVPPVKPPARGTARPTTPPVASGGGDGWLGKEPPKPAAISPKTPGTAAAKPGAGDGWLGSDGVAGAAGGKGPAVKPQVTGKSLADGRARTVVDAEVRAVDVSDVVGAVWSRDAKFVYLADKEGTIRKVSVPELVEERHVKLASPCGGIALAKGGLVAALTGVQEVWVLDEQSLAFKKRAATPNVNKVAAAPNTAIAYADFGADGVTLVNTETGQVAGQVTAQELSEQRGAERSEARFFFYELTADGKYLFCEGGECLNRLRVQGTKLIAEQVGPRIGANVQSIVISPDGKYVAMPSGGGNGKGYETYVYPVADLKKEVIRINGGAYPHTLGFDFPAKQLYTQNHDAQLLVFSPTGLKGKEYKIRDGGETQRIVVHPAGKKMLLIGERVWWVELP